MDAASLILARAILGGQRLPTEMTVKEFTVSDEASTTHSFAHGLGKAPDIFMLVPKTQPAGPGSDYPLCFYGQNNGASGVEDYPNKLLCMIINTSTGNWDYAASNCGWSGDSANVTIYIQRTQRISAGDYVLVAFAYEE